MPTNYLFNSPPGWPTPPPGWRPPAHWRPPPEWPPAPYAWPFWIRNPIETQATALGVGIAMSALLWIFAILTLAFYPTFRLSIPEWVLATAALLATTATAFHNRWRPARAHIAIGAGIGLAVIGPPTLCSIALFA